MYMVSTFIDLLTAEDEIPLNRADLTKFFGYLTAIVNQHMRPIFLTYRSDSMQTFDSFVGRHMLGLMMTILWSSADALEALRGNFLVANKPHVRRKVSAVLAHRTMRCA